MVVIVVVLFLQTWRASVIPLAAVPVSIVGTFAVMLALGLLDQHAVAVRARARDRHRRRRRDRRRGERRATHRGRALAARGDAAAMEEVSGPIIAIALVLCAVFVPVGVHQRAHGTVLSAVRAHHRVLDAHLGVQLADTVARARRRAAPAARRAGGSRRRAWINRAFGWLFRPFNRVLRRDVARLRQHRPAQSRVDRPSRSSCTAGSSRSAFSDSRGCRRASFQRRTSSTSSRSRSCPTRRRSIAAKPSIRAMSRDRAREPGVEHAVAFPGLSVERVREQAERRRSSSSASSRSKSGARRTSRARAIAGTLNQKFGAIQDAFVGVFPPPR